MFFKLQITLFMQRKEKKKQNSPNHRPRINPQFSPPSLSLRSVAACFLFLDGPASSLLAILKTFQLADCAGLLWILRVDRFAAHVALASTKNRYYSIIWLRPSFFLSLYCSQWKRRSPDSLVTDKMSGRFWVCVSGRFCDRTEEREKLRRAEDLPPKTEGLAPLR